MTTKPTLHTRDSLLAKKLPELRAIFEEAVGEPTKAPNKTYLVRRILEAQAEAATSADPWHGANSVTLRTELIRGIAALDALAQLEELPNIEPALAQELATQRQLLEQVYGLAEAPDAADGIARLAELHASPSVRRRPGVLTAIATIHTSLEERHREGAMPEGASDDDRSKPPAWGSATTLDSRLARVRDADSTARLDALLAAEPPGRKLQARVHREADAQRKALATVEAADAPALKALLGNRRTHKRTGVLAAVKARLEDLGVDVAEERPLADLTIEHLRETYEAEVGRPTTSEHHGYLVWKIREARKGRITTGEVLRGAGEGEEQLVVSLRLPSELVARLDEVWKAEGYRSRVAYVREVLETSTR